METLEYAPSSRSFWSAARYSPAWWAVFLRVGFAAVELFLAVILVGGFLFGLSFSPVYAVIVSGICVGAIVRILRALRQRWAAKVLFHIEAAVRTGLPLTEYLTVAADAEGRFVRRRLLGIVDLLDRGTPLAMSIPSGAPELSSRESRLIYAGERTGRLPQMLERINRSRRRQQAPSANPSFLYRWYVPIAGIAIFLVTGMILIFVMPKFEAIMRDFGIAAPAAMVLPIRFARDFWWLPVLVFLLPAFVLALIEVISAVTPTNPGLEKRRLAALIGRIPLLRRLNRNRSLADISWTLSADVRAGIPLTDSVRSIAELPLDGDLNPRLDRWRRLLEEGEAPAEAARHAGMPELICCILGAPGDNEGLAGSLDSAGDLYELRHGRFRAMLDATLLPATVLLLGAIALMLALSIFVPMMELCSYLTSAIGGGR